MLQMFQVYPHPSSNPDMCRWHMTTVVFPRSTAIHELLFEDLSARRCRPPTYDSQLSLDVTDFVFFDAVVNKTRHTPGQGLPGHWILQVHMLFLVASQSCMVMDLLTKECCTESQADLEEVLVHST